MTGDLTTQAEAREAEAHEFAAVLLRDIPDATIGDRARLVLALTFARHGMASAFEAACALPPRMHTDMIAARIHAWVKGDDASHKAPSPSHQWARGTNDFTAPKAQEYGNDDDEEDEGYQQGHQEQAHHASGTSRDGAGTAHLR